MAITTWPAAIWAILGWDTGTGRFGAICDTSGFLLVGTKEIFDELSPEANFFPCEILTTFFTSRFLVAENYNRFQYPGILKGEVFGTFSNPQKGRGK